MIKPSLKKLFVILYKPALGEEREGKMKLRNYLI
jgi:hypothetical protein